MCTEDAHAECFAGTPLNLSLPGGGYPDCCWREIEERDALTIFGMQDFTNDQAAVLNCNCTDLLDPAAFTQNLQNSSELWKAL